MRKTLLTSILVGSMSLFLMTACAEDSKEEQASVADKAGSTSEQVKSIMDQPVDFSTPENVEKSLQKIKEQEGEKAYKSINGAMQYILFYDLRISSDKEKLHKALDGSTPNEIIARMNKR